MDTSKMLDIVRETRSITLPQYGAVKADLTYKTKAPHDVVTELDVAVEKFLAQRLKEIDPDAGFFGEEFGGDDTSERFWLCDPIDGTAHYVRGLPFCTTMLALIENGTVNFSIIYDFVNDHLYHAERSNGAYLNGERIKVSDRPLNDAYLSWETHIDKKENLETFLKLREAAGLVKFMNCGYEFAMIASGKLEGRICFDPWGKDWDFAPGSLLVEEAGGVVANLGKRSYDYRDHDFIAANPKVFEGLTTGSTPIFPISSK